MKKINNMNESERDRLSADFKKAMRAASNIFRWHAFRKLYNPRALGRFPINKALFEAWSVGLARCSDEKIEILVKNKEKIVQDFVWKMEDDDFLAAISASTGDPVKVRKRFQVIDKIINEGISHAS